MFDILRAFSGELDQHLAEGAKTAQHNVSSLGRTVEEQNQLLSSLSESFEKIISSAKDSITQMDKLHHHLNWTRQLTIDKANFTNTRLKTLEKKQQKDRASLKTMTTSLSLFEMILLSCLSYLTALFTAGLGIVYYQMSRLNENAAFSIRWFCENLPALR